jgi:sigma-B regulation protein RsbU (phosphoserine phosphatase)
VPRPNSFYPLPHLNIANGIANLIGIAAIQLVISVSPAPVEPGSVELADTIDLFYIPLCFIIEGLIGWYYERPYNKLYKMMQRGEPHTRRQEILAKQRLLNEPFFLMLLSMFTWVFSGLFYAFVLYMNDFFGPVLVRSIIQSVFIGFLTSVVVFFLSEHILQKRLARLFFPDGGLSNVKGVRRITIKKRMTVALAAVNLIPCTTMVLIVIGSRHAMLPAEEMLPRVQTAVLANSMFFMAAGVTIMALVAKNFTRPMNELIRVLKGIRAGRLEDKVPVATNDELGYTGDVVNDMVEGLKERDQLRTSLFLAGELQKNFLPAQAPEIPGLDVAGSCLYCVETGGDYFDFFMRDDRLVVVVGDVSGHGIQAALLMASARGALRQRAALAGAPAEIIRDVNMLLAQDTYGSGMFMSLFYLEIDPFAGNMTWVRAGHDPALVLTKTGGGAPAVEVDELMGRGMILGVDSSAGFTQDVRPFKQGEVVFLGTDGIWEARNTSGDMFGRDAMRRLLCDHALGKSGSMGDMLGALQQGLINHVGGTHFEDDVTMAAVHFTGAPPSGIAAPTQA